jgi:hypothetical protein
MHLNQPEPVIISFLQNPFACSVTKQEPEEDLIYQPIRCYYMKSIQAVNREIEERNKELIKASRLPGLTSMNRICSLTSDPLANK